MDFFTPIWKGFATGLVFTLSFGTVFFALIKTGIKRGWKKSLYIALGVVLSDAFYIAIALFGSSFFIEAIEQYDHTIRIVGFVLLMALGIHAMVKKPVVHSAINGDANQSKRGVLYTIKGIALNSVNPMIFVAWLGVATYIKTANNFNLQQSLEFFLMALITMFGIMAIIAFYAQKLGKWLSPYNVHKLYMLSGIVFVVFAIVVVWPVTGLRIPLLY
jgi:threonine/homoserine/homoserine lactone efflux protein